MAPPAASAPLSALLHELFARLGSADPAMDASLAAHATVGKMSEHLWLRDEPGPAEVDQITGFCLRAVTPRGR